MATSDTQFITTVRVRKARQTTLDDHNIAPGIDPTLEVMAHGEVVAVVDTDRNVVWAREGLAYATVQAIVKPALALMQASKPVMA